MTSRMKARGTFSRKLSWQRTAMARGEGLVEDAWWVLGVELRRRGKRRERTYVCRVFADEVLCLEALAHDAAAEEQAVEGEWCGPGSCCCWVVLVGVDAVWGESLRRSLAMGTSTEEDIVLIVNTDD